IPSCTRAPPESLMKTNGLPVLSDNSITSATLLEWTSPAEPPRTVKSWLARWTSRPSMAAAPVTTPSAGISLSARPKLVCRCWANRPISSKLPPSTSASMRSRAVSLPCSRCLAWRSAPPPAWRCARFLRRSSMRFSIDFRFGADIVDSSFLCFQSRRLDRHLVGLVADFDLVAHGSRNRRLAVAGLGGRSRLGRFGWRFGEVLRPLGPAGEELGGHLRKHGVGEDILIGAVAALQRQRLGAQIVPLRFE